MYQALYRKYRPSTFDDVVGQEVIVKTLKNAIKNNKLTHAYLFAGPRGTGKTSIAKIFSKTVNCKNLINTCPCNNCVSCTQIINKQSIDIIEIDAASNNGVDEIRELRSKVSLVPSTSNYKVYIIDEVHMLTPGAFNALLKTLEEPPTHIIFILATTEPHKIPLTILSRCQRFDFKKISADLIYEHLENIAKQEKVSISKEALVEISRLSDGGLRDAISIFDQVISYAGDKIDVESVHEINGTISQYKLQEFIEAIVNQDLATILNLILQFQNDGKNLVKLADEIVLFLRNIMICILIPNYLSSTTNYDMYTSLAKKTTKDSIYNLIKELNNCILDMQKSNNPKINLELCFIKNINKSIEVHNSISKEKTILDKKEIKPDNITLDKKKIKPEIKEKQIKDQKDKPKIEKQPVFQDIEDNMYLLEKLENLKETRIDNTLARFNKKSISKIKEDLELLRPLIINPKCSQLVSLLLDGVLKACSDEYIVFIYEDKDTAFLFNQNILKIEKLLKKNCNNDYKVIATDKEEWEIIKKQFNDKTKQFEYKKEEIDLKELLEKKESKKEDNIKNLFGDIIEYN